MTLSDNERDSSENSAAPASTPEEAQRSRGSGRWQDKLVWALVVVVGLSAGTWWGVREPRTPHPLQSCAGSEKLIEEYLWGVRSALAAQERDGASPEEIRVDTNIAHITQVFAYSHCDADTLLAALHIDEQPEELEWLLNSMVADLAMELEFSALPQMAEDLAALQQGPQGQAPRIVPEEWGDDPRIVIWVGEDECECFRALADLVDDNYPDLEVVVVDEGPTSGAVARQYGWELIEDGQVPLGSVLEVRPLGVVVRNRVALEYLFSSSGFETAEHSLATLDNPIDGSAEPVRSRYLATKLSCDGHRAGGVVINLTDRPIQLVVVTDPSVAFDDQKMPLSRRRLHDIGILEPWGRMIYEVETGEDFYAPCWHTLEAAYADGVDMRGLDYDPVPPEGFVADPEQVLAESGAELPIQIKPAGFWPSAADVTPVSEGHPAANEAASDEVDESAETEEEVVSGGEVVP